ncbi:hypothetical protein SH2C18_47370 [Clostridium sediminicola]
MSGKNYVVITHAPKMNYMRDYVALPKNYGQAEYYQRKDIASIQNIVLII